MIPRDAAASVWLSSTNNNNVNNFNVIYAAGGGTNNNNNANNSNAVLYGFCIKVVLNDVHLRIGFLINRARCKIASLQDKPKRVYAEGD